MHVLAEKEVAKRWASDLFFRFWANLRNYVQTIVVQEPLVSLEFRSRSDYGGPQLLLYELEWATLMHLPLFCLFLLSSPTNDSSRYVETVLVDTRCSAATSLV